jgi:hypothetical protein
MLPDPATNNLVDTVAFQSSPFISDGQRVFIEDNGTGELRLVGQQGGSQSVIKAIGDINYVSGIVNIKNLVVDSFEGGKIKFYVSPQSKDIFSTKNTILNITEADINTTIQQIRE